VSARAVIVAGAASVALLALAGVAIAQREPGPDDVAPVPPFSQATPGGALPRPWIELAFPLIARHTRYALVRDAEAGVVVRADADASASGLSVRLDAAPDQWPRLAWRWKVERGIVNGDLTRRSGDDYPARVYVAFRYQPSRVSAFERARYGLMRLAYGEYPPHAALNYVWDAHAPVGTVLPNAYEPRVKMIVVESGTSHHGQWRGYERDIVADYRAAFGEDPPPISGVGLMSDSDDTGERAIAYYGDLALGHGPASVPH
jgi:hypothetical protein